MMNKTTPSDVLLSEKQIGIQLEFLLSQQKKIQRLTVVTSKPLDHQYTH